MPIYVFRCESCGHQFDRLQKISDPVPDTCPSCGKQRTVRKQVTAPQFRLAGSGWYETDFKSDKEKRHNLAGDQGGSKESSTDKPATTDKGKAADTPASKPAATEKPGKAASE
ncbi:MAG: FmdB family zinc ribbon protein [Rhodanobacteraceae bacterium]